MIVSHLSACYLGFKAISSLSYWLSITSHPVKYRVFTSSVSLGWIAISVVRREILFQNMSFLFHSHLHLSKKIPVAQLAWINLRWLIFKLFCGEYCIVESIDRVLLSQNWVLDKFFTHDKSNKSPSSATVTFFSTTQLTVC